MTLFAEDMKLLSDLPQTWSAALITVITIIVPLLFRSWTRQHKIDQTALRGQWKAATDAQTSQWKEEREARSASSVRHADMLKSVISTFREQATEDRKLCEDQARAEREQAHRQFTQLLQVVGAQIETLRPNHQDGERVLKRKTNVSGGHGSVTPEQ